jgi:FAD/FMN-containing dehydrogenase
MNKVAHYLQEHLVGEVLTAADVRRFFATDTSVFEIPPAIVAYPRNENDIRKTARFTWQLAERGRVIPMTARGSGTDQSGAAIGKGIILAFPAHMNEILELDTRSGSVTLEPGVNYGKLQQTLNTHGRFLPPFPASLEYSTIGGAIANNASGEKTIKYGSTKNFVDALRVVLANGEVLETGRIGKRELNKKMGLSTFEGEVYRALDTLIEENHDLIQSLKLKVSKNSAGYDLAAVKEKDGSFDLTPLFVGSQGTLGIISEAVIATEPYNPTSTLIAAYIQDLEQAREVVQELRKLSKMPCAIEVVDQNLLNFVHSQNPNQLKGVIEPPFPRLVMLIEFDDHGAKVQKKLAKKVSKLLEKRTIQHKVETDPHKKEELWKIRHSASAVMAFSGGNSKAVPIIEDGIVPIDRFEEYLEGVYKIFEKNGLQAAVWGHAGDANLHIQPFLDLGQVGDRQKVFRLIEDYYSMVIELGGSTSGEHNDGRLRGAYLERLYGPEVYQLFNKVKAIFDPYGTLNPGVKMGVTVDDLKPILRYEYSMSHLSEHLPRH